MKTFQEWLKENRYSDVYSSLYGGGNIEKLAKSRAGGHAYGGRSLANWSNVAADVAKTKREMSVDQLSRDENGVPTISTDRVQRMQNMLDAKGLTIHKEAPNRFAIIDDEGNVVFHSNSWSDIEKTLELV
jgi:hypothetical protein